MALPHLLALGLHLQRIDVFEGATVAIVDGLADFGLGVVSDKLGLVGQRHCVAVFVVGEEVDETGAGLGVHGGYGG